MPGKSQGERLDDLERAVPGLDKLLGIQATQIDNLESRTDENEKAQKETALRQEAHQRESEGEIKALKQQVADQKAELAKWENRFWALAVTMIFALASVLLASVYKK